MSFHIGGAAFRKLLHLKDSSAYRYKEIKVDQIRLLEITDVTDVVTCSLTTYSLQAVPSFRALSYVWGTGEPSERIRCNGKLLAVTAHLLAGLQTLHHHFGQKHQFWIDAICINQRDEVEKAAQVPLMSRIYPAAETVIIWLGPAADDSDLAMSSITGLNEIFYKIENLDGVNGGTLGSYSLPAIEDAVWPAIMKLTFRNWFWRLWVVQEAVLAKSIVFICGDYQVSFDDLTRCIDYVRLSQFMNTVLEKHAIVPEVPDSGGSALPIISHFRKARLQGGIYLVGLLELARRKLATEPVDKIYGVLGLMSKDLQEKIRVDYSPSAKKNFWQLYVDVARLLLDKQGLAILEMTTPSKTRHINLPSWCPDFNSSLSIPSMGFIFRAGLADNEDNPHFAVEVSGPNMLGLRGVEMDSVSCVLPLKRREIDKTEPITTPARLFVECEARCAELARKVYQSGEEIPLQHKVTLVRGIDSHTQAYPVPHIVDDYQNCMNWYSSLAVAAPAIVSEMLSAPMDPKITLSIRRYNGVAAIGWENASYFSTAGGRVGIGPAALKPGDSICIFFGTRVPYVLRFDHRQGIYEFLGSAYVHGLMTGESFYARDPVKTHKMFVVG